MWLHLNWERQRLGGFGRVGRRDAGTPSKIATPLRVRLHAGTTFEIAPRLEIAFIGGMASITPQEVEAHQLWLQSEGAQGKQIDETGLDLSGADLSGLNLARAQFVGTVFDNANLSGTNLSGADFSGATFEGADLSGADLRGADLAGVTLSGANLTAARLNGADLSAARIVGSNLSHADFTDADLIAADLTNSLQSCIILEGAKLTDTRGIV